MVRITKSKFGCVVIACLLAVGGFGCDQPIQQSADLSDGPDGGSTSAKTMVSWVGTNAAGIVAIDIAHDVWITGQDTVVQWNADGTYCTGNANYLCQSARLPYYAPGNNNYAAIRGIAFARSTATGPSDNARVWAWYADGTFSRGTVDNLALYSPPAMIQIPQKAGNRGPFTMNDLIDVGYSNNNWQYFYWNDGGSIYRTTGTAMNPSSHTTADFVTTRAGKELFGMGFSIGGTLYAWYTDNQYSRTGNSLDLR
jgi:hypothetical protein